MSALAAVRRILLAILLLGTSGTFVELLLLEHYEDTLQVVPLGLLAAGAIAVGWHARHRTTASAQVLRFLMTAFICAGIAGVFLHYRANVEFQREADPGLSGRTLVLKVLGAKAPPALAPGVMIQLGLIGLAYTHRHAES